MKVQERARSSLRRIWCMILRRMPSGDAEGPSLLVEDFLHYPKWRLLRNRTTCGKVKVMEDRPQTMSWGKMCKRTVMLLLSPSASAKVLKALSELVIDKVVSTTIQALWLRLKKRIPKVCHPDREMRLKNRNVFKKRLLSSDWSNSQENKKKSKNNKVKLMKKGKS